MRAILALLSVGAAVLAAGCGGDSSSASPTAPSLMATNDVLTGNSDDYGNLLSLSAQYKF